MSTLPKEPTYDPTIPIISPESGNPVAYKDPNSPESTVKRTKELQVQTTVDAKYDSNVKAYEGFQDSLSWLHRLRWDVWIVLLIALYILTSLFIQPFYRPTRKFILRVVTFFAALLTAVKFYKVYVSHYYSWQE
jgi:hypothetical protein